ncbi:MAG: hypothetical protein HUU20_05980 [Pirellulales bacterium]|nr:hypothetical protein [Pirellulales bacterium]
MSVTIRILSGARKGAEIRLESDVFRIGDTPGCEVYFDPRLDSAVRGCSASVQLGADGWYLRPGEPGRMLVNQAPVAAESRIRSGDVLRMSEAGPDFLFTITSRRAEAFPAVCHRLPSMPLRDLGHLETGSESAGVETSPASRAEAERADRAGLSPITANGSSPSVHSVGKRKWLIWACLGLAAAILAASAWLIGNQRGSTDRSSDAPEPVVESTDISGRMIDDVRETSSPRKIEPTSEPVVHTDAWARVEAELRESLLLVQVQADGPSGSHSWPFATGSVIDPYTVLTSGRGVLQLAEWHRQGFRIGATCPSTGLREAVKDFRVRQTDQD